MRYLLVPITLLLQHTIVYYSTYYLIVASLALFSLSWFWILLGLGLFAGLISFVFTTVPALLQMLFLSIYKGNKIVMGLHSIISLLALISLVVTFYQYPITLVSGDKEIGVFSGLWNESPIKFLMLVPTIIGMFIAQCNAFIFGPFIYTDD